MRTVILLTVFALLVSPIAAPAQARTQIPEKAFASDMDAFIRRTMDAFPDLPSVAMVVVRDGKPVFMRAYGLANKETGVRADENTLYYIASSTKSYMALAAAILDREGKIRLDDPITKYAKGLTFKTPIPEKVTVRDLLTHTSALRNDALTWRVAFTGEVDDKELLHVLADGTSFNEQNYGKYSYTNLGYNIYALLLKQTLGKRWQDVLQEKVFGPLGLKHTTAYVSKARAAKFRLADPYLFSPASDAVVRSPLEKQDNNMQSAGGIFTNLPDLARWLSINMNDGRIDGKQVVPAEIMRTVHAGYTDTVREDGPFTGAL